VTKISRDSFQISGESSIANNDGLTFVNRQGESIGLKVNKAENGTVFPDRMNEVFVGAKINRNYDHGFQMALGRKTSERKIPVKISLQSTPSGFTLMADLEIAMVNTGSKNIAFDLSMDKIPANDPVKSRANILRQLAKSGDTPFLVRDTETNGNEQYFFTSQQINELRRGLLERLSQQLSQKGSDNPASPTGMLSEKQMTVRPVPNNLPFPADQFQFENNISNRLAQQFYLRHGVEKPEHAIEKRVVSGRLQVMITRHCLQHELGFCPRFGGKFPADFQLPFSLNDGASKFELEFDCRNCLMRIFKEA
jgi:23S rRNA 5-hydroxycytidine C2501 synthase